jgi:3-hydroxyisobutyrate dehydrogenase-like beta-hydroxyacid dehydrogenase
MGGALAETFLRAGHPTTVWNRTPAKADHLVARGARLAGSPGEAVAAAPLVVVCVSTYETVHELLDPLGDELAGRVLVNLTSGTSRLARETAELVTRRGGTYLDGAILAMPAEIGTPDAVILYSGPRSAFELHESTLGSLGGGTAHLGADHGLASLYDTAMLGVMWSVLNGFLQGAALLGAAGVDATAFAALVRPGIRTVAEWVPAMAGQIDAGSYPGTDATVHTHLAAMAHLVEESESLGVGAELPRSLKALAERAVADGHGDESYAALIDLFRKPSGARP